jgi:hypothetical protein
VDNVERRHVEGDLAVDRDLELGRLDAAVGGIAIRELPLLGDHLHRERDVARLRQRVRALPAARAGRGDQCHRAEDREKEHDDGRGDQPDRLQTRVAADRRPVAGLAVLTNAEYGQHIPEIDEDEHRDRRQHHEHDRVREDLSLGHVGCLAGRHVRPEDPDDERQCDQRQDDGDERDP